MCHLCLTTIDCVQRVHRRPPCIKPAAEMNPLKDTFTHTQSQPLETLQTHSTIHRTQSQTSRSWYEPFSKFFQTRSFVSACKSHVYSLPPESKPKRENIAINENLDFRSPLLSTAPKAEETRGKEEVLFSLENKQANNSGIMYPTPFICDRRAPDPPFFLRRVSLSSLIGGGTRLIYVPLVVC